MKKYVTILMTTILMGCTQLKDNTLSASHSDTNAVVAAPRSIEHEWMSLKTWRSKHQEDVTIAENGNVDLLFLGDSITEGWETGKNKTVFDQYFNRYRSANFGIGGDQTQHLLWRLQNGSVGKLKPKVIVLMIGVNNFGHSGHSAIEVFLGIQSIIQQLSKSFPNTRVLLHGILPYDQLATSINRQKVTNTNHLLQALANDKHVFYHDFGKIFLDERGHISKELMTDFLHPSYQGYKLFTDKISPVIHRLMKY